VLSYGYLGYLPSRHLRSGLTSTHFCLLRLALGSSAFHTKPKQGTHTAHTHPLLTRSHTHSLLREERQRVRGQGWNSYLNSFFFVSIPSLSSPPSSFLVSLLLPSTHSSLSSFFPCSFCGLPFRLPYSRYLPSFHLLGWYLRRSLLPHLRLPHTTFVLGRLSSSSNKMPAA
jgi:hypothetical protein